MNYPRTLFFAGAGASASYGFPCGKKLIDQICLELRNDSAIKRYLIETVGVPQRKLEEFARDFVGARSETIDEFLERRDDLKPIARKVIGAKLITLENPGTIEKTRTDWLSAYLRVLLRKCRSYGEASIVLETLNFVTLNYDRTVEFILFTMLSSLFPSEPTGVLLGSANRVVHLHGKLGSLSLKVGNGGRPFSQMLPDDPEEFSAICNSIRFWDDERSVDNLLNVLTGGADRVVFLGFGFHLGIVERFKPNILAGKKIYSTTMGLSQNRWANVVNFLAPGFAIFEVPPIGHRIVGDVYFGAPKQTCDEFIREIFPEEN